MTFPIYLCVHVLYGALMAHAMQKRLRSEGEILGVPLLVTLAPVALSSAPLGSVLFRWAGGWFVHGAFLGEGSIPYERFHLGLLAGVGVSAGLATVAGMFIAIAALTRNAPWVARAPIVVSLVVIALVAAIDRRGVFAVAGTGGRALWEHPAGVVSLAIGLSLVAGWAFARARLALPLEPGR